jgi:asparagine synthase (glutamine-hydrolysing)
MPREPHDRPDGPGSTTVRPAPPWRVLDPGPRTLVHLGDSTVDLPAPAAALLAAELARPGVGAREIAALMSDAGLGGVAVVARPGGMSAVVPAFSGEVLCWSRSDEGLLFSSSVTAFGARYPELDLCHVAALLLDVLPSALIAPMSARVGVQTVPALHLLDLDRSGSVRHIRWWSEPLTDVDVEQATTELRHGLLAAVARATGTSASVSADLSGGVDSAAAVYLARSLRLRPTLLRTGTDSRWNGDAAWSDRIGHDLGSDVATVSSIDLTSRSFRVDAPYPCGRAPAGPTWWGDTEEYALTVARQALPSPRAHLTGLGGDELFTPMPAFVWTLVREHPWQAPLLLARASARQRRPLTRTTRGACSRTPYGVELHARVSRALSGRSAHDPTFGWCAPVTVPSFLTDHARALLLATFTRERVEPTPALSADRSRHQALESLVDQARVVRQVNEMFAPLGTTWTSPFLDSRVVRLALALPVHLREAPRTTKAALARALRGIVPPEIFARPVKGEYSASTYRAYDRARGGLARDLGDGGLAALGLIDADRLVRHLSMPVPSTAFLTAVERLVSVERWLRHAAA